MSRLQLDAWLGLSNSCRWLSCECVRRWAIHVSLVIVAEARSPSPSVIQSFGLNCPVLRCEILPSESKAITTQGQ